jgi:hypothetical protein
VSSKAAWSSILQLPTGRPMHFSTRCRWLATVWGLAPKIEDAALPFALRGEVHAEGSDDVTSSAVLVG